ncbi:hypothetical protein ACFLXB_06275 [Chloroflexota bacterium]
METITNRILLAIGLSLLLILLAYFVLILILRWIERPKDDE